MYRLNEVCALVTAATAFWAAPGNVVVADAVAGAKGTITAGWIENVYIYPHVFPMRAKIDTGADHSSLSARGITYLSRQGRSWVRFEVANRRGDSVTLERPLARTVRIKRHAGKSQDRPVVLLDMCLAGITKTVEVNLVDRTGFEHELLLGRSFLAGDFVVDPAVVDRAADGCERG